MISELIDVSIQLSGHGRKTIDVWDTLIVEGIDFKNVEKFIYKVLHLINQEQRDQTFELFIDGNSLDLNQKLPEAENIVEWKIVIRKGSPFFEREDIHYFFFLAKCNFQNWLKNCDVFASNTLFQFGKAVVLIPELENTLEGAFLVFKDLYNIDSHHTFRASSLPQAMEVDEQIHYRSSKKPLVDPSKFEFGKNIEYMEYQDLKGVSVKVLALSLCQEVYDNSEVLIDGLRRCKLKLGDEFNLLAYSDVYESVKWAYEDKVRAEIRLQLLQERISLDSHTDKSLLANLSEILPEALVQAKERFRYVMTDKKDEALKELHHLLEDLRKQSDLYANKIRSFLNNFLRDALAAVVLIAFSVFTKMEDLQKIQGEKIIQYLFKGLAVYYFVSLCFQLGTSIWDIQSTKQELKYWREGTRNIIPSEDFDRYVNESLKMRRSSLHILIPLIALLYFVFIIGIWKFPSVLKEIYE